MEATLTMTMTTTISQWNLMMSQRTPALQLEGLRAQVGLSEIRFELDVLSLKYKFKFF